MRVLRSHNWLVDAPRMDRVFPVETDCFRLMTQRFPVQFGPHHVVGTLQTDVKPHTRPAALASLALAACLLVSAPAVAQFGGGMGGMGGGMGGPQSGGAPGPAEKPKFTVLS